MTMQILTSLDDLNEAEEILQWLQTNKIVVTLEGRLTKTVTHIPRGLGIYVHDPVQFQKAQRLLREFDKKFRKPVKRKQTLLDKLKAKNLDRFIIAFCTLVFTFFVIWLVSSLIA